MTRKEKWIQGAVEKPGALRETVRRRYGERGFTERGTIKVETLDKLAREPGVTGRRARLARTLRETRRR
jgi:hypothetical protein